MLVKGRNAVAHRLGGMEATTTQVFISKAGVWLLIFCLLRDAGAPDAVFEKTATHADWVSRYLINQFRRVSGPTP